MRFLTKKIIIIAGAVILVLILSAGSVYIIKSRMTQKFVAPEEFLPLPIAPLMPPEIFISASPIDIENNNLDKTIILKINIKNQVLSCSYSWNKNLNNTTSTEYFINISKNIQTPQTYSVLCKGPTEQTEKSITLPIVAARPPTIGFTADKYEIEYKGSVTLIWSSQSATTCSLKNSLNKLIAGNLPIEGEKKLTSLTTSRNYIITCAGPGGITSETLPITVKAPIITEAPYSPTTKIKTAKTFSFSVNKNSIQYNDTIVLSWSAANFSSCNAYSDPYNFNWSGSQLKTGQKEITNLAENTVFTLNCEDSNGAKTKKSVAVSVKAASAPIIAFSANPNPVNYNSTTTLTWSVSNANICSASGAWHGDKPLSGSENTTKLTFNQFYTLICEGPGGVVNKSVSITVGAKTYTYIWHTGNWGNCNGACSSGGTQTRQVTCKRDDGASASADKCDAASKPATSQKCNTQPCPKITAIAKHYRDDFWGCWAKISDNDESYQLQGVNSPICGKNGGSSCPGKIQSLNNLESNNEGCVYSSGCDECPSGRIEKYFK